MTQTLTLNRLPTIVLLVKTEAIEERSLLDKIMRFGRRATKPRQNKKE